MGQRLGDAGVRPFVIYSLPRSRSFWLSRYLAYGEWNCGHDEIRHARSLDDVRAWFDQPNTGSAETAGAPWWRLVQSIRPDIRTILIRRPVSEVVESLSRHGFDPGLMTKLMTRLDQKLDQVARRVPDVLSVTFDDLNTEEGRAKVFEHCLPYRFDRSWDAIMAPLNLQISMTAMIRYAVAHQPQMTKLAKIAKQAVIAGMRKSSDIDGIEIAEESYDDAFDDAKPLFAAHSLAIGEAPDSYLSKNQPLIRQLADQGSIQITTARSNGRMFGYLMALISPSLEAPGRLTGTHLLFYASADVPGLGLKLQRASIERLRAKGVDEVFFRAGVRGSGPRSSALYRRLGAETFGEIFKLEL